MAQDVGGPLACGGTGQAGHPGHVVHEVIGRDVAGQAVVLRHVADVLADADALGRDIRVQDARPTRRRRQQPEQDADERRLARTVGSDEADDARLDVEREAIERRDARGVSLGEGLECDERHRVRVYPLAVIRPG